MTKISKSLDWVTAVQTADEVTHLNNIIPDGFEQVEKLTPAKWYPHRWKLAPSGVYALCATGTISQMIEFRGSDLRESRESGTSDIKLLKHCQDTCTHFTRLDYAVDLRDTELVALDFLELWHRGYFKTRTRAVKSFTTETDQPATTVYFGSEKSEMMLRVYDKAAQMKLLNESWLRVELQTRKKKASALAGDMIRGGLTTAGDSLLRQTYACNAVPALDAALTDVELDLTPVPRKDTNWRNWMNSQVFDSIVKHSRDESERDFIADWINRLMFAVSSGEIR